VLVLAGKNPKTLKSSNIDRRPSKNRESYLAARDKRVDAGKSLKYSALFDDNAGRSETKKRLHNMRFKLAHVGSFESIDDKKYVSAMRRRSYGVSHRHKGRASSKRR